MGVSKTMASGWLKTILLKIKLGNKWKKSMDKYNGGDGMQIQIDHRNPSKIITGYQFGNYYRLDLDKKKRTIIKPKHKLGEAH